MKIRQVNYHEFETIASDRWMAKVPLCHVSLGMACIAVWRTEFSDEYLLIVNKKGQCNCIDLPGPIKDHHYPSDCLLHVRSTSKLLHIRDVERRKLLNLLFRIASGNRFIIENSHWQRWEEPHQIRWYHLNEVWQAMGGGMILLCIATMLVALIWKLYDNFFGG